MSDRRQAERRDQAQTLPHNLEAERSVIGALLVDNSLWPLISDTLAAPMFFRDAHRRIYAAAVELLNAGKPLDLVSLKETLESRGDLEEVGGPAYVASLADGVPRSTNVRHYASIVREKFAHCQLIKGFKRLLDAAYTADEAPRVVIQQAELALQQAATLAGYEAGAVSLADDAGALYKELERRIENRGKLLGLSSGYPSIDLITHGLQKRKMIVVAGRTHMGKSVLALEWAKAIALAGGRVVYYSLEMERQELQFRLLSGLSGIPLELINWGNVRDFAPLAAAWELLATLPIEINDRASLTVAEQRSELRRIKAERGLAAFVTDHVQLMKGYGENRTQELSLISRDTKLLCGELDCLGIVVSQLSRGDKDMTREPQPSDLRESGALEQDADVIAMLHPYDPRGAAAMPPPSVIPMKILFKKNRGGEMGVACLNLEREMVRFTAADPPQPAPKEPKAEKPKKSTSPSKW